MKLATKVFIINYTLAVICLTFIGTSVAMSNAEFKIIYTQNDYINDLNQENRSNYDINGMVKLYQYEDKVIASPCAYSDDTITIYSKIQWVIPVEDATFVQMIFNDHYIR